MARTPVNGLRLAIASTMGAAQAFSSISNASAAVMSFVADPSLAAGDIVVVTSGWQRLDGRVARITSPSGAGPYLASLEGFNTTSTDLYPAGSGVGSVREVSAWQDIAQILTVEQSGGEQQFLTYQYIDQDLESQIPTVRSPVSLELTTHDDIALAHYALIETAQQSATPLAVRFTARDGKKWYANAYVTMADFPVFETNNVLRRSISMSLIGRVTPYAS